MKKMKSILALILALVMALSLGACGGGNEGGDKDGEKLKIALVLPGKKDDVSFNQAMYRGAVEYAEKHADTVELKVVEGVYSHPPGSLRKPRREVYQIRPAQRHGDFHAGLRRQLRHGPGRHHCRFCHCFRCGSTASYPLPGFRANDDRQPPHPCAAEKAAQAGAVGNHATRQLARIPGAAAAVDLRTGRARRPQRH